MASDLDYLVASVGAKKVPHGYAPSDATWAKGFPRSLRTRKAKKEAVQNAANNIGAVRYDHGLHAFVFTATKLAAAAVAAKTGMTVINTFGHTWIAKVSSRSGSKYSD
jgi:hypothetical protein